MNLSNARFRNSKSILFQSVIVFFAFLITIPLIVVLLYIIKQGVLQVNWHFLTNVPKPVGEKGGGIVNALVGSAIMVGVASVMSLPIGILAGIYLSENAKTKLAYYSGLCVDILQGVPSIVIGIVIYYWVVLTIGYSGLAGSVALGIMMLPIVIRSTEETLKLLPDSLKEAAYALGMPFHRVILKVIVPCGFSGILSGVMLAVARIAGETAPLLFTAFGNQFWSSKLDQPIAALPLQIFVYAISPFDEWHRLAWAGALVLIVLIVATSASVRWVASRGFVGGAQ